MSIVRLLALAVALRQGITPIGDREIGAGLRAGDRRIGDAGVATSV